MSTVSEILFFMSRLFIRGYNKNLSLMYASYKGLNEIQGSAFTEICSQNKCD